MKKTNFISFILLGIFLLITQGPIALNNIQGQGKRLSLKLTQEITKGLTIDFPTEENTVILVWATWCAPCKIEMKRLQSSIQSGSISAQKVYAFNPFEDEDVIMHYLKKNSYDFQFITTEPSLSKQIELKATPTYIWLKKDTVYRITTGISVINLWWLEFFLKPD